MPTKILETDQDTIFQSCEEEDEHPFAQIPNDLLRHPTLSLECIWLISYLLSHSKGWRIQRKSLLLYLKGRMGRDKFDRILKEAVEAGYIKKEFTPEYGRKRCKYFVSRTPKFKKIVRCTGFQDPENKDSENKDSFQNTNLKNTNMKNTKEEWEGGQAPKPPASPQIPSSNFFVYKRIKMPQEKYDALVRDLGVDKVKEMLERLDEYADINPGKFKQYGCHAAVIKKWARVDKEQAKNPAPGHRVDRNFKDKDGNRMPCGLEGLF